jgi:hypothetical protein
LRSVAPSARRVGGFSVLARFARALRRLLLAALPLERPRTGPLHKSLCLGREKPNEKEDSPMSVPMIIIVWHFGSKDTILSASAIARLTRRASKAHKQNRGISVKYSSCRKRSNGTF